MITMFSLALLLLVGKEMRQNSQLIYLFFSFFLLNVFYQYFHSPKINRDTNDNFVSNLRCRRDNVYRFSTGGDAGCGWFILKKKSLKSWLSA